MCALAEVARSRVAGGTNRVILLTDGIANRGVTDGGAIAADASLLAAAGIDIATIGFGQDAQVELLRRIAAAGRSAFHFVADGEDIAKVFVREAQSLLSPVARRLRLELELDPHLRVVRVLGPEAQIDGRLEFRLEDLNHHASQVVLVEMRLAGAPHGKRRFPARARLRFVDAVSGEERALARVASLPDAGEHGATQDVDVRRNHAIARLALAMREMATECHAGRSDAARRVLAAAIGSASRDPQVGGHPDVARVIATAARYRDVLEPVDQGSADR
jgi:Ca-activated chloride channel family protein